MQLGYFPKVSSTSESLPIIVLTWTAKAFNLADEIMIQTLLTALMRKLELKRAWMLTIQTSTALFDAEITGNINWADGWSPDASHSTQNVKHHLTLAHYWLGGVPSQAKRRPQIENLWKNRRASLSCKRFLTRSGIESSMLWRRNSLSEKLINGRSQNDVYHGNSHTQHFWQSITVKPLHSHARSKQTCAVLFCTLLGYF